MNVKACSGCGQLKALEEFDWAPNTKDGRASRCKQCRALDNQGYRKRRAAAENIAEERGKALVTRDPISNKDWR
jgi:predicted Fe-S protein YdhL (DUF1289 family)